MARFVLVHGGSHGGWCFRWLAEELADRGHVVAAPDLPCEEVGLSPLDYARVVGRQPDAIVVGHSLGGFTPHIEARARVYLAAPPPLTRREIDECFAEGFGGTVRDALGRSYWPDADIAAARLYPDRTRAQADWALRSCGTTCTASSPRTAWTSGCSRSWRRRQRSSTSTCGGASSKR